MEICKILELYSTSRQMIYQAPFIPDHPEGPDSWQSILGLEKLEFTAASIISNGIIFDLIIMAFAFPKKSK